MVCTPVALACTDVIKLYVPCLRASEAPQLKVKAEKHAKEGAGRRGSGPWIDDVGRSPCSVPGRHSSTWAIAVGIPNTPNLRRQGPARHVKVPLRSATDTDGIRRKPKHA